MDWEMTLRNEWTKGHDIGREEGTLQTLLSLVKDGLLTTQEAAARAGLTETEFLERLEE